VNAIPELPHRVRREGPFQYFFDESALGIGRVMAAARGDCTFPGDRRASVGVGTDDVDWIPEVAARGWIVVGRDKKIRKRPAEKAALVNFPLRKLVLTAAGQLSVWEQLRVLVAQWDKIEELSRQPPPWMYAVTKKGVRPIEYPR